MDDCSNDDADDAEVTDVQQTAAKNAKVLETRMIVFWRKLTKNKHGGFVHSRGDDRSENDKCQVRGVYRGCRRLRARRVLPDHGLCDAPTAIFRSSETMIDGQWTKDDGTMDET